MIDAIGDQRKLRPGHIETWGHEPSSGRKAGKLLGRYRRLYYRLFPEEHPEANGDTPRPVSVTEQVEIHRLMTRTKERLQRMRSVIAFRQARQDARDRWLARDHGDMHDGQEPAGLSFASASSERNGDLLGGLESSSTGLNFSQSTIAAARRADARRFRKQIDALIESIFGDQRPWEVYEELWENETDV